MIAPRPARQAVARRASAAVLSPCGQARCFSALKGKIIDDERRRNQLCGRPSVVRDSVQAFAANQAFVRLGKHAVQLPDATVDADELDVDSREAA